MAEIAKDGLAGRHKTLGEGSKTCCVVDQFLGRAIRGAVHLFSDLRLPAGEA
jgi:hypothetical protein